MSASKEKWTARRTGNVPNVASPTQLFKNHPIVPNLTFSLVKSMCIIQKLSATKRKNWTIQVQWKCVHSMETTCIPWNSQAGMIGVFALFLTRVDCYFSLCKSFHSITAASGQAELNKFSCKHLEQVKQSVCAVQDYNLSPLQVSEYPGGSDVQAT